jgi:hypothetical protein
MNFELGDRVKNPAHPEWGIGQIIDDCQSRNLCVFFLGAGKKVFKCACVTLIKVDRQEADHLILNVLNNLNWCNAHFSIYVIEINRLIWYRETKFRKKNLHYDPSKGYECLYVGKTWHPPEKRFEQHMNDEHAARYVYRYSQGARLRFDLFKGFSPIPEELARHMEGELARQLRLRGYAVWWG